MDIKIELDILCDGCGAKLIINRNPTTGEQEAENCDCFLSQMKQEIQELIKDEHKALEAYCSNSSSAYASGALDAYDSILEILGSTKESEKPTSQQ